MKFRDHPMLTHKSGLKTWPPLWVDIRGLLYEKPRGEVGYLKRVDQHPEISNGLFLWIEFEGRRYVGLMHFDSPSFCRDTRRILESHMGLEIRDIGEMDISYTL